VQPANVTEIDVRKGRGITARSGGQRFFIGNMQLAFAMGCRPENEVCGLAEEWQKAGRTVAYFGRAGALLGMMAFGDRIKPGAAEMIQHLRRRGVITKLVSGDAVPTTAVIAAQIGVDDFAGEVSPEGKASLVKELQQAGKRVAVIGDGVNDAPALATADLGIALGTGAEIAMSAAPVVLVNGSLEKVEETFRIAADTTRIIRQNLFWAFFYNTTGIALAISGVLNPIMAAAAMFLSSVSVIANSMRLSRSQATGDYRLQPVLSGQAGRLGFGNHRG
jgi:P-type E1-E2 ATPase